VPVWLADAHASQPYDRVDWPEPVALIVSGEAHGPSPEARALARGAVRIPMPGPAESLNTAVAAAIILFEILRQRRAGSGS
jgi:tRNA G18 (ribose-2'-O)-methylase SpoU